MKHTAALPPCFRILTPASFARGWVLETIPFVLWTVLLLLGNRENCKLSAEPTTSRAWVFNAGAMFTAEDTRFGKVAATLCIEVV